MKKLILVLLGIVALFAGILKGQHYLPPVKYAQQFTLYFNVYDSNSPHRFYVTAPAVADVHLIKDGGTAANATNSITDLGKTFSLVLTATEMTAAIVIVEVNDINSPGLYMDDSWVIPTYGHSNALHRLDLDVANVYADVNSVDGNEAAAANMLLVYGSTPFASAWSSTYKRWLSCEPNDGGYYVTHNEAMTDDDVTAAVPSVVQIAAANWGALLSSYNAAGTFGEELQELDPNITAILADTSAYDTDVEYATAIWNAAVASYGSAGSYGLLFETNLAWLTGNSFTRLGAPVGASISADIAAISGADPNAVLPTTVIGSEGWWLKRCAESAGIPW